ncbi:MAG: DNA repair protein RadC [Candidatus Krumholzibacteriia bacterium]|jgi:DNA repair protein RadC
MFNSYELAENASECPTKPEPQLCERLNRFGPSCYSDQELLALVLGEDHGSGCSKVAQGLLSSFQSLAQMAATAPVVLEKCEALGPERCTRLKAAFELGRRACEPVVRRGLIVRRPDDLHPLLQSELRGLDRERFLALFLDSRHRIQTVETVSIGSLNASLVHPREVFKSAIALSAAAIIVAHNHPSGNSRPSNDDLDLTARLDRCGELLGVALLDHLVVGDLEVTSIREFGWPRGPDD